MAALVALLGTVLLVAELVLVARIVLDWVGVLAPASGSALGGARRIVYRLTEPVLAPVRRVVPPVRVGPVSVDLAFTVVFLGIVVLRAVLT